MIMRAIGGLRMFPKWPEPCLDLSISRGFLHLSLFDICPRTQGQLNDSARFLFIHIHASSLFSIRLPAIQLIHGDADIVVPDSSSMKFGKALWDMGCRNVRYSVIPHCDHYEICLDLMESNRDWHSIVMGEILQAVKFHL